MVGEVPVLLQGDTLLLKVPCMTVIALCCYDGGIDLLEIRRVMHLNGLT